MLGHSMGLGCNRPGGCAHSHQTTWQRAPKSRSVVGVKCVSAPEKAAMTKVKRNANFGKLQAGYLFPEIGRRRREHEAKHPDAEIISLGIGDTTEPVPKFIADAMAKAAAGLATREGYSGYGAEQGRAELREAIASTFYPGMRSADEIFVSDGAKCDTGRLQLMFGTARSVAIQDPSYPVYVDTSVIQGSTGLYNKSTEGFEGIEYMLCNAENGFFPDLSKVPKVDVIFFCSPNNPTGAAATQQQLQELVQFAKSNGSIIIYDAAYALYISDPTLPKTIYEIQGADEVAIETNSFSKYAGFTGVRLGWTVIPDALKFEDGSSVRDDFNRVMTTCFNGASNIAQAGGLACLQPQGLKEVENMVNFYKENAEILRKTFLEMGFTVYGGEHSPYVWVLFPGRNSWDVFAEILEKCDIVTTPGSGFGPGGEGFIRASAFSTRANVLEAVNRFKKAYGSS